MKINVYSVFDVKAAVFANPFFMPSDAVAMRGFKDAVNSPQSLLFKHPEDYSLYLVGSFDDSVGLLESKAQPVCLCTASSVVDPRRVEAEARQLSLPGVSEISGKSLAKGQEDK